MMLKALLLVSLPEFISEGNNGCLEYLEYCSYVN